MKKTTLLILFFLITVIPIFAFEWGNPIRVSETTVTYNGVGEFNKFCKRNVLATNDDFLAVAWAESLFDGRTRIKVSLIDLTARGRDLSVALHSIVREPISGEHQFPVELIFTGVDTLAFVYLSDKDEAPGNLKPYFALSTDAGLTWTAPDYSFSTIPANDIYSTSWDFLPDIDFKRNIDTTSCYLIYYETNSPEKRRLAYSYDNGFTWTDREIGNARHYPSSVTIDTTGKIIVFHPYNYVYDPETYLFKLETPASSLSEIGSWSTMESAGGERVSKTITKHNYTFGLWARSSSGGDVDRELYLERWEITPPNTYEHQTRIDVTGSLEMPSNHAFAFHMCFGGGRNDTLLFAYALADTTVFKFGINNGTNVIGTYKFAGFIPTGISYANNHPYISLDSVQYNWTTGEYDAVGSFIVSDSSSSIYSAIHQFEKPSKVKLESFPNPFNSAVSITAPEGTAIEIFDVNGRRIDVIPDPDRESRGAAKNLDSRFHGNDRTFIWRPDESLGSGIYLVRASFGDESVSKRVVYLK